MLAFLILPFFALALPCLCPPSAVALIQLTNAICDPICASSPCQFDLNSCLAQCISSGCDRSLLANSFCDPVCATRECGWDMGDCGLCAPGCTPYIGFESKIGNNVCDAACDFEACLWDGGDCQVVYVTEGRDKDSQGTADMPYWTLAEALLATDQSTVKIAVLRGEHRLAWTAGSSVFRAVGDKTEFSSVSARVDLEGLMCGESLHSECADTPPVLKYDNLAPGKWVVTVKITLKNLTIVGGSPLVADCLGAICEYCPSISISSEGAVSDTGELLTGGTYAPQSVCDPFTTEAFIDVGKTAEAWIENVRVDRFRQQFDSVIYIREAANVHLSNVTFTNVVVGSSVLFQPTVLPISPTGVLVLLNVHVRLIGNGYAYRPDLPFGGLIQTNGLATVTISNVTVDMSLLGLAKALISIENAVSITVSDCVFTNNVGQTIDIRSDLKLPTSFLCESDIGIYSQTHISIRDSVWANNTGNSILTIRIRGDMLNINIANCDFHANRAVSAAIFCIEIAKAWKNSEKSGQFLPFLISDSQKSLYIPPNSINISSISMRANAAPTCLSLIQTGNINITGLFFATNGDQNVPNLLSSPLHQFSLDPGSYISSNFTINSDESACIGTLFINSSFRTSLNDVFFSENYCGNGPAALFATQISEIMSVCRMKIDRNVGDANSIFTIYAFDPVWLLNLTVSNNTLNSIQGNGVISLMSQTAAARFTINNAVFEGNTASEGGTVRVSGRISVTNATFHNNSCTGDTPAGLTFSPSQYYSELSLFRVSFIRQRAKNGAAMALIDRFSTRITVNLTVSESLFKENVSEGSGSCLLFDSTIGLSPDSVVRTSIFVGNSASNACVWTSFYRGVLRITECEFRGNKGISTSVIYGQHPKSTGDGESRIDIRDTIIAFNTGFSTLFLINPDKYTEGSSSNLTVHSNTGRGFYLQYAYWTDSHSNFSNNSSPTSGPCLVILFYCEVTITGTVFIGNTGVLTGGTITMGILSKVNITDSRFEGNTAERGGAIYGEQGVTMRLSNCSFRRNVSNKEGSAMYFLAGPLTSTNSTVFATEFVDNVCREGQGTVALISSYMVFDGCEFSRNQAKTASGLLVILSVLTVQMSKFADQSSSEGVFIYSAAGSSINLTDCEFTGGIASEKAGAIFLSATNIAISKSMFKGLTANYGAAIAAYSETTLRIANSVFLDLTALQTYGGAIYINESPLKDRGNSYMNCSNGIIIGEIADIDVRESLFQSNSHVDATSASGAGIYCHECGVIRIRTSSFRALRADYGACLHLYSSKTRGLLNVSFTLFESSQSTLQGAVVLDNEDALITNCQFTNNSASGEADQGDGGGLFLSCGTQTDSCSSLISNTMFVGNAATHNGGAIYWTDWEPQLVNVTFVGNTAPYGPDIASFAISLELMTDETVNAGLGARVGGVVQGVPSGQLFPGVLGVRLVDHYGQRVETDNSSLADLLPVWAGNTSISGSTRVQAKLGEFLFEEFSVTSPPGVSTSLKILSTGIDQSKDHSDPKHPFLPLLPVSISIRNCLPGETLVGNACYLCPEGKYSLQPNASCANCPVGGVCLGNCTMTPKEGYWRPSNYTDLFLECPYKPACLGTPDGSEISSTGVCATGYYGNLCHGCISGYSRTGASECAKCPEAWRNSIQICGVVLAFSLVLIFIIKMSLISAHKQQSHSSIFLKILVNYLQLTAAASSINLNWPQFALQSFQLKENAANVSTQLFSFDCFLDSGSESNQADTVYLKTVVVATIPVGILGIAGTFWGVMSAVKRNKGVLKYQLVNSIVVMFFVAHPSIVSFMFDVFNCREIEKGEYWMNSFMNIRCWDRLHSRYALLVALPSLLLWGVLTPLLALLVLISLRRRLFFHEMKIRLGFLYTGYIVSKYYWEFVIMYRKMVIIAMAVFLTSVSSSFQALAVLLVLIVSLVVHVYSSPYHSGACNRLEKQSILVSAITLYCGLFFMTEQLGYASQLVLFVLILLANAYFLLTWSFHICQAGCVLLFRHFPLLSHLLTTASYLVSYKPPRVSPSESLSIDVSSNLSINRSADHSVNKRGGIDVPCNSMLEGVVGEQPQVTPTLARGGSSKPTA